MDENELEITIDDHLDRCRLCLKLIGEGDVFFEVNETTKERFELLTQLKLELNDQLSAIACITCNRDLGKFQLFHDDLIRKQSKLYDIVYATTSSVEEIEQEVLEMDEENDNEILPEYLNDELPSVMQLKVEAGDEEYLNEEVVQEEGDEIVQFELMSEPEDFASNSQTVSNRKRILRPKAWNWTEEMEVDLIRYRNFFKKNFFEKKKSAEASDNSVYMKISRKFQSKGYPRISLKSIKYKYEKLLAEPEKLFELQSQASMNSVESDDDNDGSTPEEKDSRRASIKKTFCSWSEEMEVMLLYLTNKIKQQHPAMPDNALNRRLTKEMEFEGFSNLTKHVIFYHYKKLKQDHAKFEYLLQKVNELTIQLEEREANAASMETCFTWNKSSEAALLTYKEKFQHLKPAEIWRNVTQQLEKDGHGIFNEYNVKKHFYKLVHGREKLEEENSRSETEEVDKRSDKRNYLYWTEEMKQALMTHRKNYSKRGASGELWENIAKRMKVDGFGTFTAQNVKYKYFNLKRRKGGRSDSSHQNIQIDEV